MKQELSTAGSILPETDEFDVGSFMAGDSPFDAIRKIRIDGSEYWSAREMMLEHLGYTKWENAEAAIRRAMLVCKNMGHKELDHFPEIRKMVTIGSGGQREIPDYELSRYAAYLVAMNSDPSKSEVAAAQHYFTMRTREAEVYGSLSPAEQLVVQAQRLVNHERAISRLKLQQQKTCETVSALVKVQQEALADRTALPLSSESAAEQSTRSKINTIVRNYCLRTFSSKSKDDWSEVWNTLYRQFRDRYQTDLKQQARNRTRRDGREVNGLDIAEEKGVIEELWALATELYG